MDPNATLNEMRILASRIDADLTEDRTPSTLDVQALTERFLALDAWLTNGAFLPAAWTVNHAEVRS